MDDLVREDVLEDQVEMVILKLLIIGVGALIIRVTGNTCMQQRLALSRKSAVDKH